MMMGNFWASFGDADGHSAHTGPMSFEEAMRRVTSGPRMPGQWAGVTDAAGVCVFDAGWEDDPASDPE